MAQATCVLDRLVLWWPNRLRRYRRLLEMRSLRQGDSMSAQPDYKALLEVAIELIDEQHEVEIALCSLADGSIPSTDDRTHIEALANWLANARRAVGE